VARKQCGCVVGITVDDTGDPKGTAKFVAEIIRKGGTAERLTIEQGRAAIHKWGCQCKKKN
jgi:hypothetical protein